MVSKAYAKQFEVLTLEGADSRSVAYLIRRQHHILIHQVHKLGFKYETGTHKCLRKSGKSFESSCIFMTKASWLEYFKLTHKSAPKHLVE